MPNIITRQDAEALIPVESSKEIITAVSESSAALKLMRKLPNMTSKQRKIPILSSLPVAGFVDGDNGLKSVSAAAWKNKYITAEEIAVIIPIPEAVLDDAEYDIFIVYLPDNLDKKYTFQCGSEIITHTLPGVDNMIQTSYIGKMNLHKGKNTFRLDQAERCYPLEPLGLELQKIIITQR